MGSVSARPATIFDAMAFAGARSFMRRALVYQVRHYGAEVIEADGQPLALVMLMWHRARRVEVAITFTPAAQHHMRGLVKLAHLTLLRFVQDGIVAFAHIRTTDARAQRMARLAGFRPGRLADRSIWIGRPAP